MPAAILPALTSAPISVSVLTNGEPNQHTYSSLQFTTTSYPSNCLHFLRPEQKIAEPTRLLDSVQAKCKLKVVIVGAGLGGLATAIALRLKGHDVTVFEQAPQLLEIGAGIQIPPNSGKLLKRMGIMKHLENQTVQPERISFRRWQCGKLIGITEFSPEFTAQFEAPYYVVHRAHLHSAFFERATELGIKTRLNSRVATYNEDKATVTLADGSLIQGDLIVAADGIKSLARGLVSPGVHSVPKYTNFAVYRSVVDVEKIKAIPEIAWILEKPGLNIWVGENRHVMTYTIAAGQSFNMVLSHLDTSDPSTWGKLDVLSGMRKAFEGWDPHLTTIIGLIEETVKWPLMDLGALDNWIGPASKLIVVGDAAHAMVPYMSQGAAMAVEDAVGLAVCLNRIQSAQELKFALRVFQSERIKRTAPMQEASLINAMLFHFKDGKEQEARDAAMRAEVEGKHYLSTPNQWSDPVTQWWAYGYDAEAAMEARWDSAVHHLMVENWKSIA
ncbi:hypothetical protein JX265_005751 [Neoarthrinium moseri]|uniref:FAD-binding domain-containing protein n=1 Tax=Neoarthrinium moseri TaxID=1658444 RepID=A0A9P9WN35_9PEZI|nr:uncharacterized protein JN550_012280 [Neoarthrinium moseri]KAI1858922.1 hypothetical protein JN550_012280 [Neoarthrinium moseri]KAI1871765.1 hypothetical protein JX265_005751 [Neoarthrinium moseri]